MLPFLLSKLQFVLDVEWELNQEFLFGENHNETIILIYHSYIYLWISLEINMWKLFSTYSQHIIIIIREKYTLLTCGLTRLHVAYLWFEN